MARLWFLALCAHFAPAIAEERTYAFDDGASYTYSRPTAFGWLGRGLLDPIDVAKDAFAADNLVNLGILAGATVVLVQNDQQIYDSVSGFGRRRGISQGTEGSTATEVPHNLGNWLYFIGDARVPILTAGTLAGLGYARDDVRLLSTASQLSEMLISMTVTVQTLKVLAGREPPRERTKDGGAWHGPVNPKKYVEGHSHYNSMPSRHMATTIGAITVLAENFPEHEVAIYATGGVLAAALGFEMVNNGVHWAGDFPIGAAVGYSVGRIAVKNNRRGAAEQARGFTFSLADGYEGDGLRLVAERSF